MTTDTGTATADQDGARRDGTGRESSGSAAGRADGKGRRGTDQGSWRGVAAETLEQVSAPLEALLRKRSRRLLADLLRPYRRAVALTAAAIIVASLASLAGPWLIGIAIDNGIPPLAQGGDPVPLLRIAAVFALTVVVQAMMNLDDCVTKK